MAIPAGGGAAAPLGALQTEGEGAAGRRGAHARVCASFHGALRPGAPALSRQTGRAGKCGLCVF